MAVARHGGHGGNKLLPGKNCGLCGEPRCADLARKAKQGLKFLDDCPFVESGPSLTAGRPPERASQAGGYSGYDVLGHAYEFVLYPLPGEVSARKIVLPFRPDLTERLAIQPGDLVVGRPMGAGCPVPHVLRVIEADYLTGLLYTWVVGPMAVRERGAKAQPQLGRGTGQEPALRCEREAGPEQDRERVPGCQRELELGWGRRLGQAKDVQAYHMIGFEGIAVRPDAASSRRASGAAFGESSGTGAGGGGSAGSATGASTGAAPCRGQAPHGESSSPSWQPVCGARYTFLPGFCMMHLSHTGLLNMALQKEAGWQVRLEDIRILAGPG